MAAYALHEDRAAFRALFDRYATKLHAWFVRSTRSDELANDLVQNTFLNVHRARTDFRQGSAFRPWLYAIAANTRRDHGRWRQRRPETALDPDRHPPAVSPQASTPEQRVVRRAVELLPPHERDVVLLRWYSGLTFPEIAASLGVTATAAKVRAHRAHKTLRGILLGEANG